MAKLLATAFLALLLGSVYADCNMSGFTTDLHQARDEQQAQTVLYQYGDCSSDPELILNILSIWSEVDPIAGETHYKDAYTQKPTPRNAFFWAALADNPGQMLELGRSLLKANPDEFFGHFLLAEVYIRHYWDDKVAPELKTDMQANLSQAGLSFDYLLNNYSSSESLVGYKEKFFLYNGEFDRALTLLDGAQSRKAEWATPLEYSLVYAGQKDYARSRMLLEEHIDKSIKQLPPDQQESVDKAQLLFSIFPGILKNFAAYDAMIDFYRSLPDVDTNPQAQYGLACVFSLKKDYPNAMHYLNLAAQAGWNDPDWLNADTDLTPLKSDPAWPAIMEQVDKNAAAALEKEKAEVISQKVKIKAPGWVLSDGNGDKVDLAKLAGNYVLLDFWATWCNPCRMTMPVLDKWLRSQTRTDLKVYSVNIWERDPSKAKAFMTEKGYAMTLLMGNDNMSKDYGFDGIPHICLIDKNGFLRYQHTGYAENLGQILEWWLQDLQTEQ